MVVNFWFSPIKIDKFAGFERYICPRTVLNHQPALEISSSNFGNLSDPGEMPTCDTGKSGWDAASGSPFRWEWKGSSLPEAVNAAKEASTDWEIRVSIIRLAVKALTRQAGNI